MDEQKRIVEIGGVKIEVDLRDAKVIENYRVGDPVRVLVEQWDNKYKSLPGSIVGFDNFAKLPSIRVAYLDDGKLNVTTLNEKTDDKISITPLQEIDGVLDRGRVLSTMDREVTRTEQKLADLIAQRAYFLEHFDAFFGDLAKEEEETA